MMNQPSVDIFNAGAAFQGGAVYQQADNANALLVLAHGAGADMDHEFMEAISALLVASQVSVLRFNFPYMDKRRIDGKRRPPDRMPTLINCFEQVIQSLDCRLPIYIAGKSMGARVAAMVADSFVNNLKGVVCLGYPFHPPKKPEKLRLAPLAAPLLPTLIIQGERDTLGNQTEINDYFLGEQCQVIFLPDGDHSFKPRVKSGTTLEDNMQLAATHIRAFIDEH